VVWIPKRKSESSFEKGFPHILWRESSLVFGRKRNANRGCKQTRRKGPTFDVLEGKRVPKPTNRKSGRRGRDIWGVHREKTGKNEAFEDIEKSNGIAGGTSPPFPPAQ